MKHATKLFSADDHKRITATVAKAEGRTSAEIVPVVASRSGRYDRGEDICGLMLGLAAFVAIWFFFQAPKESAWGTSYVIDWWHVLVIVIVGFAVGAGLASRLGGLALLFTPRREAAAEVDRAARQLFFDQRIHHTKGSHGLLVYVSLLEHQAVILADAEVTAKLGQNILNSLCRDLTKALHTKPITDALEETIVKAGEHLGTVLPRQGDDQNELADALILIDA